jgi:multidrug/hemolysin transport system permease protein
MIAFAVRNLKIFFKDKGAVFFSLLAVFIVIGLYVLFLGDVWTSSFSDIPGMRFTMDSWIMAGSLSVASVTTTMGAFGALVDDKSSKRSKDFISSPLSRGSITGGYILGAIVIGIIMSLITLVLAEVYIVAYGGELLSAAAFLKVLGLIVLSTVAGTSMVLFLVSFFKSSNAFTSASTVLGTLIGFVTGIYLPIGQLPEAVQWVIKCFPVSHAAALFRQVMMEAPMAASFGMYSSTVPEASFRLLMGVSYEYGGVVASPFASVLVLLGTAAVFFTLAMFNMSRKAR